MRSVQQRRDGSAVREDRSQARILSFLYDTAVGRLLLKPLVHPAVSKLGGLILSMRLVPDPGEALCPAARHRPGPV